MVLLRKADFTPKPAVLGCLSESIVLVHSLSAICWKKRGKRRNFLVSTTPFQAFGFQLRRTGHFIRTLFVKSQHLYPVSSEISDLLLFNSYFASQSEGTTFGDYFYDVCCVN